MVGEYPGGPHLLKEERDGEERREGLWEGDYQERAVSRMLGEFKKMNATIKVLIKVSKLYFLGKFTL